MYYGPHGPTLEELEDMKKAGIPEDTYYDEVQIFDKPNYEWEKCAFLDHDIDGESMTPDEPELVPYISKWINNAEDMLNLPGIVNPLLEQYGVYIQVLTDDMARELKGVSPPPANGYKAIEVGPDELFVKPLQITINSRARLAIVSAFFALSTIAMALFN